MSVKPAEILRVDGHQVGITRPEKVLFPDDGITKGDLIRYYQRISPWMLPHLEGRPLALQRFPDGIGKPGFFQKAAAAYYPAWIKKVTVQKEGGTVKHVVCDDAATLVYLANQACITPHIWLSRVDKLQFPDQMVFDFDPSTEDFAAVIDAALSLKGLLDDLELPAYIKATGSRALHAAVPLNREQDFDAVRAFARRVAEIIIAQEPTRYTLAWISTTPIHLRFDALFWPRLWHLGSRQRPGIRLRIDLECGRIEGRRETHLNNLVRR